MRFTGRFVVTCEGDLARIGMIGTGCKLLQPMAPFYVCLEILRGWEDRVMEETFFTVEEAAGVLGCSRRTVFRLLAEGWLNGPPGVKREFRGARASKKSVFQYLIADYISRLPARTLREFKNCRKNFGRYSCQNANANRFSMDEEIAANELDASRGADPSPYPLPQGEGKQRQRCLHHEFAERHQFSFGWRARQLAPDDPAMQDDLMQEMSLAVLDYGKPATFEFLFELAGNRAIDYLRYEAARGTMSLSQARHASDSFAEKTNSLNVFIDGLMRRGVPAEWIEEVIGGRLNVA